MSDALVNLLKSKDYTKTEAKMAVEEYLKEL